MSTLCLPYEQRKSGITVDWSKTRKTLWISGWYDGYIGIEGIEGTEINLKDFFRKLGITEKDVRKAFEEKKEKKDQKGRLVKIFLSQMRL